MRILYVAVDTPVPGAHGGSVHALELCRSLSRRGHDVHILAPRAPEIPLPSEPSGEGRLELHAIAQPWRFLSWAAVSDVERCALEVAPNVVIERFYTFGGAGVWAAHRLGIPTVLEINSPARPYPGSWRDRLDRASLLRPVHRWRRQVLSWSCAFYGASRHLLPPDMQDRLTVIHCGVDVERFRPGPPRLQYEEPIECVHVSSFRSWHGAEDLARVVAICAARGVDMRVTCLGTGPRWAAARALAGRAGVLDRMRFVGQVPYERVPAYLAAADVGLAPFQPAAFSALQLGWFWSPLKIFEYLAAGLTVVTIDIPELRAVLPPPVGSFYPAGDVDALAGRLCDLAHDREVLVRNRPVARALAESRYTWDRQAMALEAILERVAV